MDSFPAVAEPGTGCDGLTDPALSLANVTVPSTICGVAAVVLRPDPCAETACVGAEVSWSLAALRAWWAQGNATEGVGTVAVACAGEGPCAVPLWGTVEDVDTKFTYSCGGDVCGWAMPVSSAVGCAEIACVGARLDFS